MGCTIDSGKMFQFCKEVDFKILINLKRLEIIGFYMFFYSEMDVDWQFNECII